MSDEKTQDKRLDAMIRTGLASGLDTSGAACPDPDLLAAFAENTLSSDERAKWNAHFARCAICQRQLAALARAGAIGATVAPARELEQQVETELHLRAHLKRDRRQLRRNHHQFGAESVNIRKYCVQS